MNKAMEIYKERELRKLAVQLAAMIALLLGLSSIWIVFALISIATGA